MKSTRSVWDIIYYNPYNEIYDAISGYCGLPGIIWDSLALKLTEEEILNGVHKFGNNLARYLGADFYSPFLGWAIKVAKISTSYRKSERGQSLDLARVTASILKDNKLEYYGYGIEHFNTFRKEGVEDAYVNSVIWKEIQSNLHSSDTLAKLRREELPVEERYPIVFNSIDTDRDNFAPGAVVQRSYIDILTYMYPAKIEKLLSTNECAYVRTKRLLSALGIIKGTDPSIAYSILQIFLKELYYNCDGIDAVLSADSILEVLDEQEDSSRVDAIDFARSIALRLTRGL